MAIGFIWAYLAVALAFAAAFVFARNFALYGRRAILRAGAARGGASGMFSHLAAHGVRWAMPATRLLLKHARIKKFAHELKFCLQLRDVFSTDESALSLLVALACIVGLVCGLVAQTPVAVVAGGACVCAVVAVRVGAVKEAQKEAMRSALPNVLHSMGACFSAGFSLLQTFQQIASEITGPLKQRFGTAAHALEAGQGADVAIDELVGGVSANELKFVAVALDVQHEAGGSMKHVLEAARDSVESQLKLRQSLKVQTAQARLSARVVTIMPFALVAALSLLSEGFLEPFFTSVAGVCLLCAALVMQLAGVLMVRRMLAVEVE